MAKFAWLALSQILVWAPAALGWHHVAGRQFESILKEHDFALVAFVNPAEPKSSLLETQWDLAAAAAEDPLVSVDCSPAGSPEVCTAISAHPTIRLFRRAVAGPVYQGPKYAAAIVKFLARSKRPLVSHLTRETLGSFQAADDVVFVAFLPGDDGVAAAAANAESTSAAVLFRRAAARYHDEFSFGIVTDPVVVAEQGQGAGSFVVCHRPHDGDVARFSFPDDNHMVATSSSDDDSAAALDGFIRDASRPIIADLTPLNHQRYLDRGWPMVYLFACTESDRDRLRESLAKLARSYRDSLTVVLADPAEFPDLPAKLGLPPLQPASPTTPSCPPSGALHQLSRDRVYPYPSGRPIDARSIQQWGLDVFQGRIKPWIPPGVSTTFDDPGPTRVATRKVSMAAIPGVKIKIAGHDHDEL